MTTEIEVRCRPIPVLAGNGHAGLLVEEIICPVCGGPVDVNGLGLVAGERRLLGERVISEELSRETVLVLNALRLLWAVNHRVLGLCGHLVTVDAAADVAQTLEEG